MKVTHDSTSYVMQFLLKSFFMIWMHHYLCNGFLLLAIFFFFLAVMNFFIYKILTFLIISLG